MQNMFTVAIVALLGLSALPTAGQKPPSAQRGQVVLQKNCLSCHGDAKLGGLDLRQPLASAKRERLYRVVSGLDKLQMPPGKRLSAEEISLVKSWVAAPTPLVATATHWAFRPVQARLEPPVEQSGLDAFLLAKLKAKGLGFSKAADKRTLLRRVSFDLSGLPPTPGETTAFLADTKPGAYERVVARLLASPAYGERQARRWLDLARYADSEGFKGDEMRPTAWRYRDYVVRSFNSDKPYDRFVREQLAGDELWPGDPEALLATGFSRHFPDESNARNIPLRRQEILNDITDVTGSVFLGLTVGCARCHDHKYDPVPQKDYYRLQAFFAAVRPRTDLVPLPASERVAREQALTAWEEKTHETRTALETLEKPVRERLAKGKLEKFPDDLKEAVTTPPEKRTSRQWVLVHQVNPQIEPTEAEVTGAMDKSKPEVKTPWTELTKTLKKDPKPAALPTALGITDVGPNAPRTFLLTGGLYDQPGSEVTPGFLQALGGGEAHCAPSPTSTGRRAALANWLTSPRNTLTARVMVNRLWQQHFGRGLVGTGNDFGVAGERPTHPELLDWLTERFIHDDGWSLKKLHQRIVLSAAYRQSATQNPKASKLDPENTLLWRFRRQRLEGESIRDALLAVSGQLNSKQGGPGVMAELPAGLTTTGYWKETTELTERNRRSLYLFVKRNLRYPLFEAFDFPDTHEPCARRSQTTSPLQALLLLNDTTALRLAKAFAEKIEKEVGADPIAQITHAWERAYNRPPQPDELTRAVAFLKQSNLTELCHALFNTNEFLYVE